MFYYNRQIIYMDVWKAGERAGNAGFLKLEETDRGLRWQIKIRVPGESDTGFFDLRDETGALVDKILLQKGEGSYERTLEPQAVTRGGRFFREICGLRVELPGGRYLKGTWRLSGQAEFPARNASAPGTEAPGSALPEWEARKGSPSAPETAAPKSALPEWEAQKGSPAVPEAAVSETGMSRAAEPESGGREFPAPETAAGRNTAVEEKSEEAWKERNAERNAPKQANRKTISGSGRGCCAKGRCLQAADTQPSSEEENGVMQQTFFADKWEQLQHMYPQVHPFGDERMFLSITPGDFVILGREYQKLVHNSFLLHGYYNYRHVILGRYPDEEGESYYLGVPGVYYEREKMAAEMFGFEAFEGKREPAQQGDFGYYMKRVRI